MPRTPVARRYPLHPRYAVHRHGVPRPTRRPPLHPLNADKRRLPAPQPPQHAAWPACALRYRAADAAATPAVRQSKCIRTPGSRPQLRGSDRGRTGSQPTSHRSIQPRAALSRTIHPHGAPRPTHRCPLHPPNADKLHGCPHDLSPACAVQHDPGDIAQPTLRQRRAYASRSASRYPSFDQNGGDHVATAPGCSQRPMASRRDPALAAPGHRMAPRVLRATLRSTRPTPAKKRQLSARPAPARAVSSNGHRDIVQPIPWQRRACASRRASRYPGFGRKRGSRRDRAGLHSTSDWHPAAIRPSPH